MKTEANSKLMHYYERYQNHLQSMKVTYGWCGGVGGGGNLIIHPFLLLCFILQVEKVLLEKSTAKSKAMTRTLERCML